MLGTVAFRCLCSFVPLNDAGEHGQCRIMDRTASPSLTNVVSTQNRELSIIAE